jgi:molecular chaperone GrpE
MNQDANQAGRPATADEQPEAALAAATVETVETVEEPITAPMAAPDPLAALQQELEQVRARVDAHWNLYLSAKAEADNTRKRVERDLENSRTRILKDFIDAVLPVKDSLESGLAVGTDADVNQLREGSELTLKLLGTVLEKFGVQELNPLGERFNPDFHEAMAIQPAAEAAPNTVLYVIQKGYLLNARLIRPARVIVAQAVAAVAPTPAA